MRAPLYPACFQGPLRVLALVALALAAPHYVESAEARADSEAEQFEAGQEIYRFGRLPSGKRLVGLSHGDIPLAGSQVACENCHRRSGLGSSEGGNVVPPITGPALFFEREPEQRLPFRSRSLRSRARPAYDAGTLSRAIRSGIDSAGNPLDPLMPRYQMSNAEIEALNTYLVSLSSDLPPGLTETSIHFATIAAENANPSDREAMLEILHAFVRDKNANSRNESGRRDRGAYYRDSRERAYRRWVLHTWQLKGSSESWPAQLEELYRAQPVFAVLGGLGKGSWRPVHDFCESKKIPCLFPITDLPVTDKEGFYSIYISGGLFREAESTIRYLSERLFLDSPPVVQVYRPGTQGAIMAKRIHQASIDEDWRVRDVLLEHPDTPSRDFWLELFAEREGSIFLVWLPASELAPLSVPVDPPPRTPEALVLSETITGPEAFVVTGSMRNRTRVVSLLERPAGRERSLARLKAWLSPREIELDRERVQADTYLSATLVASATKHMRQNFSREYLIEIIEHGMDNAVFRSVYPRLTLGPNQRIASKSCFVLRPSENDLSEWLPVEKAGIR